MRDPYLRYFLQQRRAITHQFVTDMSRCHMALAPDLLEKLPERHGWRLVPLEGTRGRQALVLLKEADNRGQPHPPELWVRHGYSRYRAAFTEFLARHHGLPAARLPREWQVDHLCSRALFQGGRRDFYVRLVLLSRAANASFGGGYEKLLYAEERKRGLREGYFLLLPAFLKVRGERMPSRGLGMREWMAWAEHTAHRLDRRGIGQFEVTYDVLTLMLNLAYEGSWNALPQTDGVRSEVERRAAEWDAADKRYVLVGERREVPVPLGVYSSPEKAVAAVRRLSPGLRWKEYGTGERAAWDESVEPNIQYRIFPVRTDSDDLLKECHGALHLLDDGGEEAGG